MREKRLDSLQMCRAIAALLVVFFHTTVYFKASFLGGVFYFGFGGVDFFFVLSGFIISYTSYHLIGQRNQLKDFARKRFVRIYPIYWLYIAAVIACMFLIPSLRHHTENPDFSRLWQSIILLLNDSPIIISTSWSLGFEIFFYLLFGLLIFSRRFVILIWLILALSLVNLAGTLDSIYLFGQHNMLNAVFSPLNFDFILGYLAFRYWSKFSKRAAVAGIVIGVAVAVGLGIFFEIGSKASTTDWRVILYGIPSSFIVAGLVKLEYSSKIKIPALLVLIGDASYTLYLLHEPVLKAMENVLEHHHFLLINHTVTHLLMIVFVTVVSIIMYRLIENPLVKKLNRLLKPASSHLPMPAVFGGSAPDTPAIANENSV
jgi:peptidoglycan/LPS O-acetylase OafA/YrhL